MNKKTFALCFVTAALVGIPAVASAAESSRYENCPAAAAEGVYNIHRGHPDYHPGLDSDNDGVGCEKDGKPVATVPAKPTTTTTKAATKTTTKPEAVKTNPKFTG